MNITILYYDVCQAKHEPTIIQQLLAPSISNWLIELQLVFIKALFELEQALHLMFI